MIRRCVSNWIDFQKFIVPAMISLLGNSLAILVFRHKDRKITVPEIFLLNIAALDLILAMTSCSAPIIAAFSHRWIFGEIGMNDCLLLYSFLIHISHVFMPIDKQDVRYTE